MNSIFPTLILLVPLAAMAATFGNAFSAAPKPKRVVVSVFRKIDIKVKLRALMFGLWRE